VARGSGGAQQAAGGHLRGTVHKGLEPGHCRRLRWTRTPVRPTLGCSWAGGARWSTVDPPGAAVDKQRRHPSEPSLAQRALAIRQARLRPDHPDTAESLDNLAGVLRDQGDLESAHPLYERALAIYQARLDADHPAMVRSRQRLAMVVAGLDRQQLPFIRYSRNVRSRVLHGRWRARG
jgi:Tetratricopeptide repeat